MHSVYILGNTNVSHMDFYISVSRAESLNITHNRCAVDSDKTSISYSILFFLFYFIVLLKPWTTILIVLVLIVIV